MARGKKTASSKVTILPKENQPFPVPENWFWTDIDSINQYSAISIDPMKQTDMTFELYSVPSSADDYPEIIAGSEIGSTKQSVIKNDVLLCKINPRINRVWKVSQYTENELAASSEWIVIRNSVINPDYLMFCFRSQYFRELMLSNVSGVGGSLMRAQPKFVKKYPIPIAPLAEQHRIVSRIESLFVKLDEAKEKAQAVVDSFELRKSAILHKAFTGELTKQWRKEHGVGLDSWKETVLKNVITLLSGQDFSPEKYNSIQDGLPYITGASNFEKNHVIINRWTQTPTVIAYANDVLLVCKGSGFGKVIIADFSEAHIARQIMSLRPHEEIHNRFLYYFLQYQSEYIKDSGQGLIPGISRKVVLEMGIVLPILEEQKECVSILDNLFIKEQQAKESAESVLTQIDTMKKAILARAFRGELGTNDPAEENAAELIMSILNTD